MGSAFRSWCSEEECFAAVDPEHWRFNSRLVLDRLLALEEWRSTLLADLGLPENAVTLINSFLCLLERTRLTPEESQRLLRVPQPWSSQLAARKWTR